MKSFKIKVREFLTREVTVSVDDVDEFSAKLKAEISFHNYDKGVVVEWKQQVLECDEVPTIKTWRELVKLLQEEFDSDLYQPIKIEAGEDDIVLTAHFESTWVKLHLDRKGSVINKMSASDETSVDVSIPFVECNILIISRSALGYVFL